MQADSSLSGKKIWVTRPARQSAQLCRMIEQRRGIPVKLPTVVIQPARPGVRSPENRRLLERADIVIFISKNAVLHALELFAGLVDTLRDKTILAVGRATAENLLSLGLDRVGYARNSGGTETLLQLPALSRDNVRDKRVVIVRGEDGREALRDGLQTLGARVDYLEVYRRGKPAISRADMRKIWHDERPDAVIVTSLTGLDHLVEMMPPTERGQLHDTAVIVMSRRIEQHALATGFTRVAVATDNSDAGLVNALVNMKESA